MYSIHYSTTDPYSRYGIYHFIERSGIPFLINPQTPSKVAVSYGTPTGSNFSINVRENEIQPEITGNVTSQNKTACICEIPHEMEKTGDEVTFDDRVSAYPCSSTHQDHIDIGIDIFKETGYLLSGHLDRIWNRVSEPVKTEISRTPTVDFLEKILMDSIISGCVAKRIPLIHTSLWPEGKPFAVCLTHDVDEVKKTYQWITRPARAIIQGNFSGLKRQLHSLCQKAKGVEPYWTFEDICAIERDYNARSTFFFLQENGRPELFSPKTWNLYGRAHSFRDREVARAIEMMSEAGHEIGIHGSFHSYKTPSLLVSETRELEEISKKKVFGIRQHHLNLDVPRTWKYQVQAGLNYDCSLGYKDRIGFRWGTAYPFSPFDGETAIPITEIPLAIMDICLLNLKDPLTDCFAIAGEAENFGGVLTLLWHPPVFNPDEFPQGAAWYRQIIELCAGKNAWIACARDIAGWQKSRTTSGIAVTSNGPIYSIGHRQNGQDLYISVGVPENMTFDILSDNARIHRKEKNFGGNEMEWVHVTSINRERQSTIEVSVS